MFVEHRFDLGRIDIEAGADDQLFGATNYKENVVFEPREIAGVEPAIGVDHRGGRLGVPVISPHHIGARTCSSPTSPGATAPPPGFTSRASIPVISEPTALSLLIVSALTPAMAGAHSVMP